MKAFGNYHPLALVLYFLSVLLTSMFTDNPIIELSALLGGALFCLMLQKRSEIPSDIVFYTGMFILTAITNPLFSHNGVTPLFFLNGNPVTLEAIICGISIAVTVTGVMLWCKCYSIIMTSDKLLCLFGKVAPKLSLILSAAIRFIPLFKRRFHSISKAQRAMGLYSSKSIADRLKFTLQVFSALLSQTLEASIDTSASMKARGYGIKGRTSFTVFRFYSQDKILLTVSLLLLCVTLIGLASGSMSFLYYPRISRISTSVYAVLSYTAFSVLSFLPSIIEFKELLTWKYYVSKI